MNTIAISYQPVDGVDVRVAESDGDGDETLILTSPWPESEHAFESTWSALSGYPVPHTTDREQRGSL